MDYKQKNLLYSLSLRPYMMNDESLNLLKVILDKEIEMRQEVRNKELKLDLAKKVEEKTGKDQHIEDLKQDLFLARKVYAKHVSEFDEYKYVPGYVERDQNGKIAEAREDAEDRLKPIVQGPSVWQVSVLNDDGTETVLGVQ